MNNDFALETERMVGRKWRVEDAEDAFTLYSDPEVMRYLGGGGVAGTVCPDVETQRANLVKVIEQYKDSPFGAWAMRLRDSGELVAVILLKPLPNSQKIEIGWHLPKAKWGNGYATEGGKAAAEYGFKTLGLNEIYAVAYAENTKSTKVMERIGMRYLGQTSDFYDVELSLYVMP